MKTGLLLVCGGAAALLCGCQTGYVNNYGFGSTMPGVIYSDQTRGDFMGNKLENIDGVTVLGRVHGESSATNVLLLVARGNCGIAAAKADAMKAYPYADDIVNIEVDTQHESILCLYNTSTTKLTGYAIKYKPVIEKK